MAGASSESDVRSPTGSEIQLADKRRRIVVSLVFVAAVAIGAVSLLALLDWLKELRQFAPADAQRSLLHALVLISAVLCGSVLVLGLYFWRTGARVRAAALFPLPRLRVIRDTAVLRDDTARRRGKVLQRTGVVLVLCALALCAAFWRLYSTLPTHAT